MDDAQTILKMIESVDPKDTNKLGEIDARVWCWMNDEVYENHKILHHFIAPPWSRLCVNVDEKEDFLTSDVEAYTRSRDALKAIRPEGWYPADISMRKHGGDFVLSKGVGEPKAFSRVCATEELAELHAIIQAIEWERKNG